ncbi:uncharacterized protein LOC124444516 isoform X1 [Xenia sp. Carnegie-2017]|uniref:uncharacterized protein LOC124444516 isoform X1 n=1 Tax=Xenia sp. Carnegie-2017 TaxID=2897299 RepID=UPI001F03D88A|nr:uncharacterized protein LOC124444516 isoform X1 [Xenia sp. Carnegie-2017]
MDALSSVIYKSVIQKLRFVKMANFEQRFTDFNSALQNEFQRIESQRQDLESREKRLTDEKTKMMQIDNKSDDVISLNIGGESMTCLRSTLCQIDGSLLASMFSGRWEDRLTKDKDGNVFLDYDPECFKFILNYLRAKKMQSPERQAIIPSPPQEKNNDYWILINYLGLENEFLKRSERRLRKPGVRHQDAW